MYNKHFNPNLRAGRAFFATLMLLMLTTDFAFGQTTKLCETLADVPITNTTIDVHTTTATLPNTVIPGINPNFQIKSATGRLILVGNMVTITSKIVTFTNCDIRMAEGAGFIVPSGKILRFLNCRIAAHDCNKLWNTIKVESGGFLSMTGNPGIEDALSVITVSGTGTVFCENNTLNRNYKGIDMKNSIKGYRYLIRGNTFSRDGDLIDESTVSKSSEIIAGINAENIGDLNLENNNFLGLSRGISLKNTICNVTGGSFKNINPNMFGSPKSLLVGNGIFISNNSKAKVSNVHGFDNCTYAGINVVGNGGSLDCQNSHFKNLGSFGIIANGEPNNFIENNIFSSNTNNTSNVLVVNNFSSLTSSYIGKNIINLSEGIEVSEDFSALHNKF